MPSKSSRPSIGNDPRRFLEEKLTVLLRATVAATCRRCLNQELAFKESQRSWRGFVSTCEVLETILLPMLDFGDDFFPKTVRDRQQLEKTICDNLLLVVEDANRAFAADKPLCPGDPYVNTTGDAPRKDSAGLPYIEANAFLVSTLLHFLLNIGTFREVPDALNETELSETAGRAIDQILECFVEEKGWSYSTKDHDTDIYFTWSVVETLVEVLEVRSKLDLLVDDKRTSRLKECLSQVRADMELYLFGSGEKPQQFIFNPNLIETDRMKVYHGLQAFIVLGILETHRHLDMAQCLISLVGNSHLIAAQRNYEVGYSLEDSKTFGNATLRDSSILPLVVRSIATVFGEYPNEDFFSFTEKSRLRDPWSYLIMTDRIAELKDKQTRDHLWGPEGDDYQIYYTERVVEALVSSYHYVRSPGKPARSLDLPPTDITNLYRFNKGLKEAGQMVS